LTDEDFFERAGLVRQLRDLGVKRGSTLVVHCSFRAVRPVRGGPSELIGALTEAIGPTGTLVMPSMTDWEDDRVFDPSTTPCRGLGVVADTFWRMPGVLRSDSPHSFAARGPHAVEITRPHPPDFPHGPDSPIGRVHDLDGQVLLLGVGYDANTTIHLAEFEAGAPYRIPKFCTVLRGGVPTRVDYGEIDHCCRNFGLVGEWLERRGLERLGQVGNALARLVRSRDVVATVVEELEIDACRFLCRRGAGCDECDAAWDSVGR
jgi:aminoglycoside 3-N-acetyltransferase